MLQEYHRKTILKTFGPIFKDQSDRCWKFDSSAPLNLSLLSISKSSLTSDDDDEQISVIRCDSSSSSRQSSSIVSFEESELIDKSNSRFDAYILHKHLYGITSSRSNLLESDVDKTAKTLFEQSRSSYRWGNDDFHPRAIRPPPFTEHMEKMKNSSRPTTTKRQRSAPFIIRTTRAESLKLERLQSARETSCAPNSAKIRPLTSLPQTVRSTFRPPARHSANPRFNTKITRCSATSESSHAQSVSTRSCKLALGTNQPLQLSKSLVSQMHQDIRSNRVPAYSKPLNSALLREQPNPIINRRYKMNKVRQWLNEISTTDFVEFNDFASHATTAGTLWNDKLDDDTALLSDEKQKIGVERSVSDAHRVLPLFKSEIERKLKQRDLVLTRIELDLYAI